MKIIRDTGLWLYAAAGLFTWVFLIAEGMSTVEANSSSAAAAIVFGWGAGLIWPLFWAVRLLWFLQTGNPPLDITSW